MNNIPIFDSLTHPTIDSNWILPKYPEVSSIRELINQMNENNISKALAVGMKGIGGYNDKQYIELTKPYLERLIPISYFDLNSNITSEEAIETLRKIKFLGFNGIKLHPRISGFNLSDPLLVPVIKQANELQLNVLLCTYFYGKGLNAGIDNLDQLAGLLFSLNGAKIVLLHGGSVRLLELIEITRPYENVLVDLSFTLCKYKGSSLDSDIRYAFESFDRRICVGSDFPEFSPGELRERFIYFTQNLANEKAENIGFQNITNFLKIN